MRSNFRVLIAARALALSVGFLVGCTAEQVEPPTTTSQSGDSTGPSTTETTTTDDATGGTTDDQTGGTTDDPTGGDACEGPNGCYDCPPTQPVQLLNACTDASCEPFPNTKERLPLLNDDGTLPPLP